MKHLLFFCSFLLVSVLAIAQWTPVGYPGFSATEADYPSLAFSPDGVPYVAYSEGKATVKKFDGTNWITVGSADFSAGMSSYNLSLAFSPAGVPYVAYANGDGDRDTAALKKFDGTNWVTVGSADSLTARADYTSLAFSPDGMPYVAYEDEANGNKATVMRYNSTTDAWENVGTPGFSAGIVLYTSLAFSPDGVPYVAYTDIGNGYRATVKKFDGTNWITVGSAGFSAGEADYTFLAFGPDGVAYVAYRGEHPGFRATVMKFDGTDWVTVGSAGFSASAAERPSLAFSPAGVPYVAYSEGFGKATVMKFDGNNWVPVGTPGFSAGGTAFTSLAFSPAGVPYVAYTDNANGNKATVMVYDSIAIKSLNGGVCPGASVQVNYTAMGYYNSDNTFTAQLSDATGSFNNPVTIGTNASNSSSAISATIPSTTPPGSGYRIRVVANDPAIIGSDNGKDLSVQKCTIPNIRINDVAITEGNSGTKNLNFTVTLSKKATQTVQVDYHTINNTAVAPSDYCAKSGTLTFPAGVKRRTISISIKGDRNKEGDETFKVVLSNAVNATIADNTGIGTIINDDGKRSFDLMANNENSSTHSLTVSPNPANSVMNVVLSGFSGKVMLNLMDLQGRALKTISLQEANVKIAQQQFNVSDVATGTYFIVVMDEHGNKATKKVVVMH